MRRSAALLDVMLRLAVLLPGTGSVSGIEIVALLEREPRPLAVAMSVIAGISVNMPPL